MKTSAGTMVSREMADADTPLIFNAWYVIATSAEVTRSPMSRQVLGHSVVLFRTEAGKPVALQNRCCHRSFPLARGRVEGDTIVCGYHGLRYDTCGRCVEIPMQTKTIPDAIKVRAYPTMERGPLIWIWMGDDVHADMSSMPHREWMDHPDWEARLGYLHIKGSYVYMHENLLDLSHIGFLHGRTFGGPDYTHTPVEVKIEGNDIQAWRHVECELPPIYAKPLGWTGARALRSSGSQFVAPGLHINTGIFRNLDSGESTDKLPTVKVAQLLTPETKHSTHYWYMLTRNFVLGDTAVGDFMMQQQLAVFTEDAIAMAEITALSQQEESQDVHQISLLTDRAGLLMRRHLKYLSDREQQAVLCATDCNQ